MTNQQDARWYQTIQANYETKADELLADGYEVQNEGMRFIEHFTKDNKAVQIIRKLGNQDWYVTDFWLGG